MNSSTDKKCERCGSPFQGQICPFCTITGLDVNALLAAENIGPSLSAPTVGSPVTLVDIVSNRVFTVKSPLCRIGRDISNDIVLSGDKSLSRFHFQITFSDGNYYLEDAGSRNGTFLNGSPVTSARRLLNGDVVSAGMSRYRFLIEGEPLPEDVPFSDRFDSEGFESIHAQGREPIDELADAISEPVSTAASATGVPAAQTPAPQHSPPAPALEATEALERSTNPEKPPVDPLARLMQEGAELLSSYAQSFAPTNEEITSPTQESSAGEDGKSQETFSEAVQPVVHMDPAIGEPAVHPGSAVQAQPPEGAGDRQKTGADNAAVSAAAGFDRTGSGTAEVRQWPSWCLEYRVEELENARAEAERLREAIRESQLHLSALDQKMQAATHLKNHLLATEGAELVNACSSAFEELGWQCELSAADSCEIVLRQDGKPVALARIISTDQEPHPSELASLVSNLSTFWSEHKVEPKGLLVVSFRSEANPDDRPRLSQDYTDYAAHKNVCVLTTVQLLRMYFEVVWKGADAKAAQTSLLEASGLLT